MRGTDVQLKLQSVVACPHCGHQKKEEMTVDACLCFYDCENCKQELKPKDGECCVYCSFGSTPCPAQQEGRESRSC